MFTNNMHKWMQLFFDNTTYNGYVSGFKNAEGTSFNAYATSLVYAGIGGRARYMYASPITAYVASTGSSGVGSGLYLGSGSTPATVNDYKLESPITSGLSITGNGNTPVLEHTVDGVYSYNYSFSVKNTSDSEINIYEIGLFLPACGQYHKEITISTLPWHSMMIKRDVLTEPITIAPGASKVINYKLTFNQTLNVD